MIQFLFSATLFLSAFLLFWIQPIAGKALLPKVGGSAMVWQSSLAFFQLALLGGYTYAHWHDRFFKRAWTSYAHTLFLISACAFLPWLFTMTTSDSEKASTVISITVWMLLFKGLMIPFLALACNAPLLQSWWATSNHSRSHDPYYLYACSNAGSLTGLLIFPVILEPRMGLDVQLRLWSYLFVFTCLMVLACRWSVASGSSSKSAQTPQTSRPFKNQLNAHEKLKVVCSKKTQVAWFVFSFIPCSLMLTVTGFLTNHLVNMPFFGMLPLALFLFAYILVFSRSRPIQSQRWRKWMLLTISILVFTILMKVSHPVWLVAAIHLAALFCACMVMHARMADVRPDTSLLTRYYFLMATGGVMAGIAHTFIAPMIFDRYWEYPIGLAMVLWFGAQGGVVSSIQSFKDVLNRWSFTACLPCLIFLATHSIRFTWLTIPANMLLFLKSGIPALACWFILSKRMRYGALAILLVLFASDVKGPMHTNVIEHSRNSLGTLKIVEDARTNRRIFFHGNTIHGSQFLDISRASLPLSYYHQAGPLRRIFKLFESSEAKRSVGVIGLGVGATAAYAKAHEDWTFYEIDPDVIRIAKNRKWFTFLDQCQAKTMNILEGDARIELNKAPDEAYGLIILDAFSSDSIPMHLMTIEALDLYLDKLAPKGIMAWHLSNRYLQLEGAVARLAELRGLHAVGWKDEHPDPVQGREPSFWVVMTRTKNDLGKLLIDERFTRIQPNADVTEPWTDQKSSLLEVLDWH